jgi:hypothetical protein
MRPFVRNVGFALVSLMVVALSASAQRTTTRTTRSSSSASSTSTLWELGADAGIGFDLSVPTGGAKTTQIQIPLQSLRAGFFINPQWSLEPSLGYRYIKVEGLDAVSFYTLGFAGLYHFSTDRMHRQIYLRPFLGLLGISSGGQSDSDTELGVGAGMKWPKMNGRMAWRAELNLAHQMDAETTSLNVLGGISFFSR